MGLEIGLAGATGALGKEILEVLDEAPWRPERVVPLASPTTAVSFVEYGGDKVAVDDLSIQALDELDALILAVPPEVARSAGERAIDEGVPVIDCSGAWAEVTGVPVVVPWVNPEALVELGREVVVAIPSAGANLLAAAIGPLRRAGVRGEVEATVMVPASAWGRQGIEELSAQVVALFNQGTPPRKVFDSGLAFDLMPVVGAETEGGWSAEERRIEAELRRLTGLTEAMAITVVGVPVFSGISAAIHLRTPRTVDLNLVERILQDGGVTMPEAPGARYVPRPRRVDGDPFAQVGRLRAGPGGLHLWASMDNLRSSASVAVALCGAVLKQVGLLD